MSSGGISNPSFSNAFKISKEILKACRLNGIKTNFFLIQARYFLKLGQFFENN